MPPPRLPPGLAARLSEDGRRLALFLDAAVPPGVTAAVGWRLTRVLLVELTGLEGSAGRVALARAAEELARADAGRTWRVVRCEPTRSRRWRLIAARSG